MPNYSGEINNFVGGDDLDIVRTITNLPSGQTITEALFTVKLSESGQTNLFQITGTVAGTEITFAVTNEHTALLNPGNWCYYDIQIETSAGKIYTPEKGRIKGEIGIT